MIISLVLAIAVLALLIRHTFRQARELEEVKRELIQLRLAMVLEKTYELRSRLTGPTGS